MDDAPQQLRLVGRAGGFSRREQARAAAATVVSVVLAVAGIGSVAWIVGLELPGTSQRAGTALPEVSRVAITPAPRRVDLGGYFPPAGTRTLTPADRKRQAEQAHRAALRVRQGKALDRLLDMSARGRRDLALGLERLRRCGTGNAEGIAHVGAALGNRLQLLTLAHSADVDAVPHGRRVRQLMITMWTASRDADALYLQWGAVGTAGGRCARPDGRYQLAQAASGRAAAAKRSFLTLWNGTVVRELRLAARPSRGV